ncbi:MAG TPA: EscU/YscU/HrcU family type III secretion system export apparatus switch protein, partial [Aquabacterium sp.]|nr:EscU/YscU/HrcU family type III secretion system export apparatus switch protein [Aquabacterium sp.]
MAEAGSSDKTEKASAQKLRKAREQGQVARSKDLSTAVGLLVALKLMTLMMPVYLEDFRAIFLASFADLGGEGALDNVGTLALPAALALLFKMLMPLAAVPLAVIVAS